MIDPVPGCPWCRDGRRAYAPFTRYRPFPRRGMDAVPVRSRDPKDPSRKSVMNRPIPRDVRDVQADVRVRVPRFLPTYPRVLSTSIGALIALTSVFVGVGAADGPNVVVVRATTESFPLTVEAIGTARANESVEIRAQISETIRAVHFEEGQWVDEGAMLVTLEDAEAVASVAAARAAFVESMRATLRRGRGALQGPMTSFRRPRSSSSRPAGMPTGPRWTRPRRASRRDPSSARPSPDGSGLRRVSPGSLVGPSTIITTLDDIEHHSSLDFDVPETALSLRGRVRAHRVRARSGGVARLGVSKERMHHRGHAGRSREPHGDRCARSIPNHAGNCLRPGMFLTVRILREGVIVADHPRGGGGSRAQ